jgi:type II restriction/modification system DNA methylase subunit YeeA
VAKAAYQRFLLKLRDFEVLDPACGSGNFLYLALLSLKDLEHRAMLDAEVLGFPSAFPEMGPQCVMGIELSPSRGLSECSRTGPTSPNYHALRRAVSLSLCHF